MANPPPAKKLELEEPSWVNMINNPELANVTLVCQGQKILCSKDSLGICSPVFKKMFQNNFKEGQSNECIIKKTTPEALSLLLKLMHGAKIVNVGENVIIF